jgi:hypothetical protein
MTESKFHASKTFVPPLSRYTEEAQAFNACFHLRRFQAALLFEQRPVKAYTFHQPPRSNPLPATPLTHVTRELFPLLQE